MPASIFLNVAVSGLLTGLVYGLMALRLSVIFGVVRVVNFAHGEMMTIAMYIAVALFSAYRLDPFAHAGADCGGPASPSAMSLQAGLINPFINRPEHTPIHAAGGSGDDHGQCAADSSSGPMHAACRRLMPMTASSSGPLIVDATKAVYAAVAAAAVATACLLFRYSLTGKAIRACADNYQGALVVGLDVTTALRADLRPRGRAASRAAGSVMVLLLDVTPALGPSYTLLAFVIVIVGGLGSMPGALLGGMLIGITEALAGLLFTPSAKSMFASACSVLVLLFRPQGILGKSAS